MDTRELAERQYAGWTMAYRGGSRYVQDKLAALHKLAGTANKMQIDEAHQLIHGLAAES